ncbi:MAG: penicillin-binding transpeptidase domain-containing protein [Elusimicrobia bacterium]|jgi:beta-lactamase class D|nr:penicillin-binding transpeptidase domain-containing protein [Elusimicrobiota bacterium]
MRTIDLTRTCGGIALALASAAQAVLAAPSAPPGLRKVFKGREACFILYDMGSRRAAAEYGPELCSERLYACSTFKVPLALMAFDRGLLADENTRIPWDKVSRRLPGWDQDQTPRTWLARSAVWVSQGLAARIGMARLKRYLADFRYGNQDMSGGLTQAWLGSSLKLSAHEQRVFMERFWRGRLAVSRRAVELVKSCLVCETSRSRAELCGKTGSAALGAWDDPAAGRLGRFVGHLQAEGREYIVVTDFRGPPAPGSPGAEARRLAERALAELDLF